MADLTLDILNALPSAAFLIYQGQITAANAMARHYLSLPEGSVPIPSSLALLSDPTIQSGTFSYGLSHYSFRCTKREEGYLVVFDPAPQTALTDTQLDGVLRQMRSLLGDILLEVEAPQFSEDPSAFRKTFHRFFRLMDNLELVRTAGREDAPFHPVTMDLAGLCRQLVEEAASLFAPQGVTLDYRCNLPSLLISGDPRLLQRLLLELISNSVGAMKGKGSITLTLQAQGNRALLILTDSGAPLTDRKLNAMLQQDTDLRLPPPEAGAGLGLTIAREIVSLHRGTLLIPSGTASPTLVLALPTALSDSRVPAKTPPLQRDGGLSPMLIALSDVLPAELFRLVDMD